MERYKLLTLLLSDDDINQQLAKEIIKGLNLEFHCILCHFEISYLTFAQCRRFLFVLEIDINCRHFLKYMFTENYINTHDFKDDEKVQIIDINNFIIRRNGKKGYETRDNKYYSIN